MAKAVPRSLGEGATDGGGPDRQLLDRFVSGADRGAFRCLVQRYGPLVFGVCVRLLGNEHDAEDAYQATFLVLARKAGSLRVPESLGPWLYGVAYRTALKARAEMLQRRGREQPFGESAGPTGPDDLHWHDLRPVLDEEVNRLPAKHRAAVVLCYFQGKTNDQAARILGCPPGTVFSRLAAARDSLRRQLTRRGLTLPAAALVGLLTRPAAASPVGFSSEAALAFAAGRPVGAGTVSAPAVTLAKGVLRVMFVTKVKLAAAVLLGIGVMATVAGVLAGAGPDAKAKSDADAIQGTWEFVSAEEGGQAVPDEVFKKFEVVFAADKVNFPIKQEVKELGYKLDPAKKPKQIDLAFSETETAEGIYELDGDKLRMCMTKPGHGDRPAKFDSTEGRETVLLVLQKKK